MYDITFRTFILKLGNNAIKYITSESKGTLSQDPNNLAENSVANVSES